MIMNAILVLYLAVLINITGLLELRISISEALQNSSYISPNLIPFVHMNLSQGMMNVLLFFPLGVLLPNVFLKNKWSIFSIAISCFVVTFTIEILQFFGGRSLDVDDMITNIIGGVLGFYLTLYVQNCKRNKEEKNTDNTKLKAS